MRGVHTSKLDWLCLSFFLSSFFFLPFLRSILLVSLCLDGNCVCGSSQKKSPVSFWDRHSSTSSLPVLLPPGYQSDPRRRRQLCQILLGNFLCGRQIRDPVKSKKKKKLNKKNKYLRKMSKWFKKNSPSTTSTKRKKKKKVQIYAPEKDGRFPACPPGQLLEGLCTSPGLCQPSGTVSSCGGVEAQWLYLYVCMREDHLYIELTEQEN